MLARRRAARTAGAKPSALARRVPSTLQVTPAATSPVQAAVSTDAHDAELTPLTVAAPVSPDLARDVGEIIPAAGLVVLPDAPDPSGVTVEQPRWRTMMSRVAQGIVVFYLLAIVVGVVMYKAAFVDAIFTDPFLTIYGLVVCAYIVSRFLLSLFYRPTPDVGLEPRVAIVMPAFNEEEAIAASVRSLLALDYPADKLEVVFINDGSTDATLAEVEAIAAENPRVRVINFVENQGKRAAMAAGIRATEAEIIAFVDSDSVLEPDAMRILVQDFADPTVGAVCGHADVLNVRESWLSRMQAVRYFVAFKVVKAAEGVFSAVTCCSGCFSAYRREAIVPRLSWWENQRFLGLPSTFGDDRSLTNCVLRDWKVKYQSRAIAHTIVPAKFRQFMKQQVRWKRSWTRESLLVSLFIWRKHPAAALATYVGIVLPLLAPFVALRAMFWQPLVVGAGAPFVYLVGIYSMALVYSLYYAVRRKTYDTLWVFGILFVFFYLVFLLWQTYYAIITARRSQWGTRDATPVAGISP
jgi:hyaluronan synthase